MIELKKPNKERQIKILGFGFDQKEAMPFKPIHRKMLRRLKRALSVRGGKRKKDQKKEDHETMKPHSINRFLFVFSLQKLTIKNNWTI